MLEPTEESHPAIGLDYGDTRIGVAATDELGILAHPVTTIQNQEIGQVLEQIANVISQRKIKIMIPGLPLRMDGTEGSSAEKVRKFSKKLAEHFPDLPLELVDESFTTTDAAAKLRQAGKKAHQQKNLIDQAAAVEILNRWMGYEA